MLGHQQNEITPFPFPNLNPRRAFQAQAVANALRSAAGAEILKGFGAKGWSTGDGTEVVCISLPSASQHHQLRIGLPTAASSAEPTHSQGLRDARAAILGALKISERLPPLRCGAADPDRDSFSVLDQVGGTFSRLTINLALSTPTHYLFTPPFITHKWALYL